MTEPHRIMLPGPRPPVVVPPAVPPPPGALGNDGEVYGIQSRREWAVGEFDARVVCDAVRPAALWRFSCFGPVYVTIIYGTGATRQVQRLQAPVVITIPGQFVAQAQPTDPAHAAPVSCEVALTQATAGARAHARRFITAAGGAVAFSDDAVQFVAFVNSTLTISGAAVAVPALATVPLVAGSLLNTGSGFQEFEA